MRVALFGGTFDPIHQAHLAVAAAAADLFQLDRVIFVPAAHPPHKAGVTHAPYEHRLRMTELACESDPRFEVSRLEEGAARSYSIDTIGKVRARLAQEDELFFILGADAFAEIGTWHRWREVVAAVSFLVVSRPGHVNNIPTGVRLQRLDSLELPISSSDIRRSLSSGERPATVPLRVLEYIYANGLYGTQFLH
jgi:nicotinate-nucleotide adenylyltransferase